MPTEDLLRRVCGEFLEMPGLRLSLEQAQRLWGLDAETCALTLDRLVDARFLRRTSKRLYEMAADGPARVPAPSFIAQA
jgi:hypothetical protein